MGQILLDDDFPDTGDRVAPSTLEITPDLLL